MSAVRISVVGVGGGGCKVIDRLASALGDDMSLAAIDSDARALSASRAAAKVQIGQQRTKGLGSGGDPRTGRMAADEDAHMLRELFMDSSLAIVVAGLGGGTATGAVPVVLRTAREAGAFTLCIVTLPFAFEGEVKEKQAELGLRDAKDAADVVIAMPNDTLFRTTGNASVAEAFHKADDVLCEGIVAIWKMIREPGYISLGFSDLRKLSSDSGICTFGYGIGRGKDKAERALHAMLRSPLLDQGEALSRAGAVLVSVRGGPDLTLKEINDIMDAITEKVGEGCTTCMGTSVDEKEKNRIVLSVVAAEKSSRSKDAAAEQEKEAPQKDTLNKRKRKPRVEQTKLGFDASGKGRFKDVEPTIMNGEDLDIPTFVRRGIQIEK